MSKGLDSENLKAQVIVHVLDFIDKNDDNERKEAINKLSLLAKHYTTPLKRRVVSGNLKDFLKAFILNNKGYLETIPKLYNNLHK